MLLTLHSTHNPEEYCRKGYYHERRKAVRHYASYSRSWRPRSQVPVYFLYQVVLQAAHGERTQRYLDGAQHYNKTPPYVMNVPDARFIDLAPLRHRKPKLLLFMDGVDIIIDGETTVDKDFEDLNKSDPAFVVGKLLGSRADDSYSQETLEHGVEVDWTGPNRNRATELLGNLMAGTSTEAFAKFLGPTERGEWVYTFSTVLPKHLALSAPAITVE
ncbi:uncharacterized protein BT62DRAFT_694187 [Guyanagaster necrorhizus]|uniref:Uncharacterized protein n=1 Tax=Guyanagaster necrorhizus TaxID=856835 RepID=A0A9P8ALD2_9AGAR|nr:uncharacterized protein BT62DRAFT_694187 [Guyanagaster necrorhizus MCA 3950]KAG7439670.1 hypothetical protein BT62DRAFT_694187 [Guyanagaster necrorhizus MCA 3950]